MKVSTSKFRSPFSNQLVDTVFKETHTLDLVRTCALELDVSFYAVGIKFEADEAVQEAAKLGRRVEDQIAPLYLEIVPAIGGNHPSVPGRKHQPEAELAFFIHVYHFCSKY